MNGKTAGTAALLIAIVISGVAVALVGAGTIAVAACTNPTSTVATAVPGHPMPAPAGGWPAVGRWNSQQIANAAIIVTVGRQLHVPPRGWVIAVATAMQESSLTNLGNLGSRNDHDSLGLFQQRPSQGWGTPAQIMDPIYASTQFYTHLLQVPHWQDLPLADAAQAVQHSAAPSAYAKWETEALSVVAAVSGLTPTTLAACRAAGAWTQPVRGPIVSGFRTPQRPNHHGVDIAVPRGTIIRAASAGTVIRLRCNVEPASWGCDRDGHPTLVKGCGWYLDVSHAARVITRYCHLAARPSVHEGQSVAVGEPVGIVGSSGNSSGPHLHFEIHLNADASSAGAVDPILYMRQHGAPIG